MSQPSTVDERKWRHLPMPRKRSGSHLSFLQGEGEAILRAVV